MMRTSTQPLRTLARAATKPPPLPQTSGTIRHHLQRHPYSSTPKPTTDPAVQPLSTPLNIPKWLETNSHLLQPPINNYCVHHDPLTVMLVGGPNARTEYHINTTPEFFYQHRGRMLLKTVDPATNAFRDIYIEEGELFLLPGGVPHNPVRFGGTVGVVVEQPRPDGSVDRLRWYCGGCGGVVHEASFFCTDLGSQIKEAVVAFEGDGEARECKACGEVCQVRPSGEAMERMRMGGK